jgi:hypothetical protein
MRRFAALTLTALLLTAAEGAEAAAALPEALRGFRGMMIGTITAKGQDEFILRVERITRTWKQNRAENPAAAVGQDVVCVLWPKGRLYGRHRTTLAELKVGDRVLVEPFHLETGHRHLTVVEELRKVADDEPDEGKGGVSAGARGFRGMVAGTLVATSETAFTLKVERVVRVWKHSKAKHPESLVGQTIEVRLSERFAYQKHLRTLRDLTPGDRVVCEPFHNEAGDFTLVEELRKAD